MNFVYQLNTVHCDCGRELYREDLCLPFGGELGSPDEHGLCRECCGRFEAAVMAERSADFRFMALAWLTREIVRKPVAQLVDEKWAAERAATLTQRVVAAVVADSLARAKALAGERMRRAS